ncbi:ZrgA family zinc uptake protein [Oceanisphaera sp. W20_SRM_FM3]|uniref:ZrgA family zinc uptake protein n=1 Tax=Oceanisphaera sp. W20_SRM_FM3 TaxID=3240267 RepID=UPI003F97C92C
MKAKFCLFALPLLPLSVLAAPLPDAHESGVHQEGAHQHGLGSLSLALNEQQLILELHAPAADIVGFEHAPQNIEQEQQQTAAFKRVQDANLLFTLPKQAECTFIESKLIDQDEDELNEHEDNHEAKADNHKAKSTGADEHQNAAHDHDHDHDHDEHGHSDVLVQYHYQCLQPQALTSLDTQLFEQFASFNKIELQGIIANSQVAATLSQEQTRAAW